MASKIKLTYFQTSSLQLTSEQVPNNISYYKVLFLSLVQSQFKSQLFGLHFFFAIQKVIFNKFMAAITCI